MSEGTSCVTREREREREREKGEKDLQTMKELMLAR